MHGKPEQKSLYNRDIILNFKYISLDRRYVLCGLSMQAAFSHLQKDVTDVQQINKKDK